MSTTSRTLSTWLRGRKDLNDLELGLMALQFDLEGALDAGQHGLAWIAQDQILCYALQLYVARRDDTPPTSESGADRVAACLARLERWNVPLAEGAWQLVLRPVRLTAGDVEQAVAQTLAFVTDELGISAVATRTGATRTWAEGVDTLRRVASRAGLASSDTWYLPSPTDERGAADWLDDVLSTLPGA